MEKPTLALIEVAQHLSLDPRGRLVSPSERLLSAGSQLDEGPPAIVGVCPAGDKTPGLEAIGERDHELWREAEELPELVL